MTHQRSQDELDEQGWFELLVSAGGHMLAVALLAAGSAVVFSSAASRQVVGWAWREGVSLGGFPVRVGVHIGLCAAVWAALVVLWRRGRRLAGLLGDQPAEGAKSKTVKLSSRRGTVLTETLIVLPVALLLIMGIAQLALVNIAATLSDLAVIEAARSVWVWAPEAEEGRMGVDRALVTEKARVQAAAILAPAASSDFGNFSSGHHPDYNGTFRKAMGAIYGAQLDSGGQDTGSYARDEAELKLSAGRDASTGTDMAFNLSFDSASFEERTVRKFFSAWAHTQVEIVETNDRVGAKMTYDHLCLLPLVAGIFGQHKTVGGDEGYYVTIERSYSLRKQVNPNASLPRH